MRANVARSATATRLARASSSSTSRNDGVAFGAFAGGARLVVVDRRAGPRRAARPTSPRTSTGRCVWLPTGLLLGGALGNIIDRVRDGAVTDFIKLPAWPAFNVADMAITFGVLALLYVIERPGDAADARRLTTRARASTRSSPARWARARGRSA